MILKRNKILFTFITILLISVSFSVAQERNITNTSDNLTTFIRNSNGNYWPANGSNIQLAIDDLGSSGGTIILPSGTFFITEQSTNTGCGICLTNNTILEGQGTSTIIKLNDSVYPSTFSRGIVLIGRTRGIGGWYSIENVTIRNLMLDGNKQNNVPVSDDEKFYSLGININVMKNVNIENVFVTNCISGGIYLESTKNTNSNINLNNIDVSYCGKLTVINRSGIHCDNIKGVSFSNIDTHHNIDCGLFLQNTSSVNAININSYNNSDDGIYISSNCFNINLEAITKHNIDKGGEFPCNNSIIKINSYQDKGSSNIVVNGNHNIITASTTGNATQIGLYVTGDNNTITSHTFNHTYGVFCDNAKGNTFTGSIINNQYDGIRLYNTTGPSEYNSISVECDGNGQFLTNSYADISFTNSSHNFVQGCLCKATYSKKIRYNVREFGNSNYNTIIDNYFSGSLQDSDIIGSDSFFLNNYGYLNTFSTTNITINIAPGFSWFNTTSNQLNIWNGTSWVIK